MVEDKIKDDPSLASRILGISANGEFGRSEGEEEDEQVSVRTRKYKRTRVFKNEGILELYRAKIQLNKSTHDKSRFGINVSSIKKKK